MDPSSKNYYYRGLALYNLERAQEALEDFEKAIKESED
jgi:tetratricopeptide (TPR) repeat protein